MRSDKKEIEQPKNDKPVFRTFCLIGGSGAGKDYILNNILNDKDFVRNMRIKKLIYGTTREPRSGEIDGQDYYFYNNEDYYSYTTNILESRCYDKSDEGEVYYFTDKKSFFDVGEHNTNYICITSCDQLISYLNYFRNFKDFIGYDKYRFYCIYIDANPYIRFTRSVTRDGAANNDEKFYEICRRLNEEKDELSRISLIEKDEFMENRLYKVSNERGADIKQVTSDIKNIISKCIVD